MMPLGKAVPASEQERVLGIKIARAMLSGPREITKDAIVAEMASDGNLIILRQGTNDWVCFPGDENEIGNIPMCADPMGLQWMMDIRQEAQAHEYGPGSYLHAVWCYAAQQHSIRSTEQVQLSRLVLTG